MVMNEFWGAPLDKCAPLEFNRMRPSIFEVSMT